MLIKFSNRSITTLLDILPCDISRIVYFFLVILIQVIIYIWSINLISFIICIRSLNVFEWVKCLSNIGNSNRLVIINHIFPNLSKGRGDSSEKPNAELDITLMPLPTLGITAIDRSFGCRATDKTLPDQV